ncbi:hypothetical protein RRG08_012856 [Elysia crispata]|uniref:Uncharacterized protein n=1 Tax=Elysia crispata TaxID=231223 RepID=A0AAE1E452_9GAST|nr:hypothetical protein RRG08_012856 [Elysia crispata]
MHHHNIHVQQDQAMNVSGNDTLLVDFGASLHILKEQSKFNQFDQSFDLASHIIELVDGSQNTHLAESRGDDLIHLVNTTGVTQIIALKMLFLYLPFRSKIVLQSLFATTPQHFRVATHSLK